MSSRPLLKNAGGYLLAFSIAMVVHFSFVRPGWSADGQLATNTSSSSSFAAVFEKDTYQSIKGLGYSDQVAQDLIRMIRPWGCESWREKLSQAVEDVKQKKLSWKQYAQVEESAVRELAGILRREIANDKTTYDLASVVRQKRTQCLGFTQLFEILGTAVGLTVKPIVVSRHSEGPMPPGEAHIACAVGLHDGRALQVDMTLKNAVSRSFVFVEEYVQAGYYWELKDKNNRLHIHRRIQLLGWKGLIAQLYNSRGAYCAKAAQHDKAFSFYDKAIELSPKDATLYLNRGITFANSGQFAKALSDCTKAIEIDPLNADAYNNRGASLFFSGQRDKALPEYAKAIELNPLLVEAYNNRGMLYRDMGKLDQAISDYDKAIEIDSKSIASFNGRGTVYMMSGKFEKALSDYTKVIEIQPKFADAYPNRAVLYVLLGKTDDAKKDLRTALLLNPNLKAVVKKIADQYKLEL